MGVWESLYFIDANAIGRKELVFVVNFATFRRKKRFGDNGNVSTKGVHVGNPRRRLRVSASLVMRRTGDRRTSKETPMYPLKIYSTILSSVY